MTARDARARRQQAIATARGLTLGVGVAAVLGVAGTTAAVSVAAPQAPHARPAQHHHKAEQGTAQAPAASRGLGPRHTDQLPHTRSGGS